MTTLDLARPSRRLHLNPILAYSLKRILWGIFTLWIVSIAVFAATVVLPGSAASSILGMNATPEAVAALEHAMRLDQPLVSQYMYWFTNLLHGDLGQSLGGLTMGGDGRSVGSVISTPLQNSLILAAVATVILIPLSIFLGVFLATRAGSWLDHGTSASTLVAISLPEFVVGTILIVIFATKLQLVPATSIIPDGQSPLATPNILVLPVITLLAVTLAASVRMIRAGVSESLRSDSVMAARLGGVPERRVLYKYALRNGLAPGVQVLVLSMQWLLGGIVITEFVFGYRGIGQLLVNSINIRDVPTVQAIALLLAAIYIGLNIIGDIVTVLLVPKLRSAP